MRKTGFSGDHYWQYSRWGVASDWPKRVRDIFSTSKFPAPLKIDAALKWTNNKSYVFTNEKYYRLSDWKNMKVGKQHIGVFLF